MNEDVRVLHRRYPCCGGMARFTDPVPTVDTEQVKDCRCGKRWRVTFMPVAMDLGTITALRAVWTRVAKRGEK